MNSKDTKEIVTPCVHDNFILIENPLLETYIQVTYAPLMTGKNYSSYILLIGCKLHIHTCRQVDPLFASPWS